MKSLSRTQRPVEPAAKMPDRSPALMDRLEGRVYFAHLGHEVFMPEAASHGQVGHDVVATTYTFANHRRSKLILPGT